MGREALCYSVVAASSRPVEQQSCPYLPAVLRRLTGVTKNRYCRGERAVGHRYPESSVCTRVVFFCLHGEQWEYVVGPGLLVREQMNTCLFQIKTVPLLILNLCLGAPFPAGSMQRSSTCGWSQFGFLSLVLVENLVSSLAFTCSPSPFDYWDLVSCGYFK